MLIMNQAAHDLDLGLLKLEFKLRTGFVSLLHASAQQVSLQWYFSGDLRVDI